MFKNLMFLLALLTTIILIAGCDEAAEDAAEKACADITGFEACYLSADDIDAPEPKDWYFLIGFKMDDTQSLALDQDFEVDLSFAADFLPDEAGDSMLGFAKIEALEGYGNRLRYANKLILDGTTLKLDSEAIELLGDSIGSSGAGVYAVYYAGKQNGYINGVVKDCAGDSKSGILATASDGPFFTFTADDGSWALPTLSGKPATINFSDGEDCSGSTSDPSTEDGEENPKPEAGPEDTPPMDEMGDGTDVVDSGTDEMDPPGDSEAPVDGECIALEGWDTSSGCWGEAYGFATDAYADLFPAGGYDGYMYVSSGGSYNASCTVTTTVTVPSGMTVLEAGYNFASQEYLEWVGSAYNDIFTIIVQGAPDYLVNRTVNNIATSEDWMDIPSAAATIANIANSDDAAANGTGKVFDGSLKYESSDSSSPRGEPEADNVGNVATVALPDGFTTITILITVSDVGDQIYDSVGLVDHLCFK